MTTETTNEGTETMKTPWRMTLDEVDGAGVEDSSGRCIQMNMFEYDAADIVRCVNAHDSLVEACRVQIEFLNKSDAIRDKSDVSGLVQQLRDAIAQAETTE